MEEDVTTAAAVPTHREKRLVVGGGRQVAVWLVCAMLGSPSVSLLPAFLSEGSELLGTMLPMLGICGVAMLLAAIAATWVFRLDDFGILVVERSIAPFLPAREVLRVRVDDVRAIEIQEGHDESTTLTVWLRLSTGDAHLLGINKRGAHELAGLLAVPLRATS